MNKVFNRIKFISVVGAVLSQLTHVTDGLTLMSRHANLNQLSAYSGSRQTVTSNCYILFLKVTYPTLILSLLYYFQLYAAEDYQYQRSCFCNLHRIDDNTMQSVSLFLYKKKQQGINIRKVICFTHR